MSRQCGVPPDTLQKIDVGTSRGVRRSTYNKVGELRYEPPVDHFRGAQLPTFGVERRLRALVRAGFTLDWIVSRCGMSLPVLSRVIHGRQRYVHAFQVERVRELYEKFEVADPVDCGVTENAKLRASLKAERYGWEPRTCWDPDTIDDPEAFPEWTGACGTAEGARIHIRERIPVCPRCAGFSASEMQIDRLQLARSFDGQKFKAQRLSRGFTQKQVEIQAGLAIGQIHHWESGRHVPRDRYLYKALEFMGIGFEDVMKES